MALSAWNTHPCAQLIKAAENEVFSLCAKFEQIKAKEKHETVTEQY